MKNKAVELNLSEIVANQIRIANEGHTNILKNIGINRSIVGTGISIPNPKIRMAQIGGPDIVGERISSEPIVDKFGDVTFVNGKKQDWLYEKE